MRIIYILLLACFIYSCKPSKDSIVTERISTNLFKNPKGLNPLIYLGAADNAVNKLIFLPLCEYNPETLVFEPVLAKSVPASSPATDIHPEGIKYDFEIKEEAKWDNGNPITAEDVLFSLKTIFLPSTNAIKYRSYMKDIYDCKVDPSNNKKGSIYFIKPSINAKELISNFAILEKGFYDRKGVLDQVTFSDLIDKEAYAKREDKEKLESYADLFNSTTYSVDSVRGSGPYRLKEWLSDQFIVLEKKEDYWAKNSKNIHLEAFPKEIQFIITVDKAAAFTQMKAGAYDIYEGLSQSQAKEILNSETYSSQYNIESVQLHRYYMFILNSRRNKLQDIAVRNALANLVDIDTLIQIVEKGEAERINSPFLSVDKYSKLKDIKYNPEKASKLLAEAGWKDSNNNDILDKEIDGKLVELELKCLSTGSQLGQLLAGTLSQNAKEVGIKIEMDNVERSIYQKRLKTHDFDFTISAKGLSLAPFDPYSMFHTDNSDEGENNYGNFGNEESDALIEKIRTTEDVAKRQELYLELEKMIHEQQAYIFLYSPTNKIAIKKNLEGVVSVRLPGYALQTFKKVAE